MKNLYFTVYKTTNLVNGKIYIGKHITEDPNDRYLGSGHLFYKAIQKYGIKNFRKEVLFIFDNEKEMLDKERELVNEEFIKDDNNYNLIVGGTGNFTRLNGNAGTNNKLIELNSMPSIWICNPAIGIRRKIWNRTLTKDEILAGWEYGSLSKANYIQVVHNGETISIKMLAWKYGLNWHLMLQRYIAGWSTEELLSIPESLYMYKSEEQQNTAKKLAKNKKAERRMQRTIQRKKKQKEIAQRYYKEYISLGQTSFQQKYDIRQRHYIYSLFRKYINEYNPYHRGSPGKRIDITYNGKTQALKKWITELNLSYNLVFQMHLAGLEYEKIFSLLEGHPKTIRKNSNDIVSQTIIAEQYLNKNQQ